jgi:hypothetical protein
MKKLILTIVFAGSLIPLGAQDVIWKLSYDLSFPFGNTKTFTDQVSWRGLSLDMDRLINDNLALGLGVGWNTFVQKYPDSYYQNDEMLLHGTQVRYINDIPITARFSWYQPMEKLEPYVTLGVGTVWQEMRREIGLFSFEGNYWQFVLAPELGAVIPVGSHSYGIVKIKYTQGFKTGDNENALSFLSLGLGVAW